MSAFSQEVLRAHLRNADETSEAYKQASVGADIKSRMWMSFALHCVRALCVSIIIAGHAASGKE